VDLDPDSGSSENGLGDLALAPRFLLAETDRLLLSLNFEVSTPTGDEDKGLGAGEVALAPTVSWWLQTSRCAVRCRCPCGVRASWTARFSWA